jgi:hypothetical protein
MKMLISRFIEYRPRIAQFFGLLGFLAGATMFYYENSFISYPDSPETVSGRTVAYVVKYDLVRYVTPAEAFIAHSTHYVLFISGFMFLVLGIFELKKSGRWFKSDPY